MAHPQPLAPHFDISLMPNRQFMGCEIAELNPEHSAFANHEHRRCTLSFVFIVEALVKSDYGSII
jgi:hypothetical protein